MLFCCAAEETPRSYNMPAPRAWFIGRQHPILPRVTATNGLLIPCDAADSTSTSVLLPPWMPETGPPPPPPANNPRFGSVPQTPRVLSIKLTQPWLHVHCGQVDAASSVPAVLYDNEALLHDYIRETLSTLRAFGLKLELGTCAEHQLDGRRGVVFSD